MAANPDGAVNDASRGTSVLLNAIVVLRSFSMSEPELGVSEIARRVGLHKSTVSRILSTLRAANLVERDAETRRFRLGLGVIALAGPLLADLNVRRISYPLLRDLSERTGETSALMLWNGTETVCVEQVGSRHFVKHTTPLGTRYNEAVSASVQVFLAMEGAERVRTLLGGGFVSHRLLDDADIERYLSTLRQVITTGYAVNYGETSLEEVGVSAPVSDHRGTITAAVLISAPRFRVSEGQLSVLGEACVDTARQITSRLGGTALPRETAQRTNTGRGGWTQPRRLGEQSAFLSPATGTSSRVQN
ncbi:IclR family transcriptional regulator [Rathayibacter soli]|uniref:IclR family transcriptional regulator n=1 Tax=Rathayibacter soli TaxID=3144168 RepID=UPI0027E43EC6|nr:IclR family transcriptional regulator [Glaciibacter superstes]